MHGVLLSLYKVSLRSMLEAEVKYQEMVKDWMHYTTKLHSLAKKISNGSENAVVDNVLSSVLESMHSIMIIHSDEYELLLKCLEATRHQYQVAKECKFNMATEGLRNTYIDKPNSKC